jgi:CxxC motif-containing protein
MKRTLTCIECPIGCEIEVELEDGKVVSLMGNGCLRGKAYAEAEVVCPKRVVTSTVRAENGEMIPVKTDKPVRKDAIFEVMQKINQTTCKMPVALGDILVENICDDANLIVTGNF